MHDMLWERFVFRELKQEDIYTREGYLRDPITDQTIQDVLLPFSSILDKPCSVLLGEAGIGKTRLMQDAYHSTIQEISRKPDSAIYLDLGCCDIFHDLFERLNLPLQLKSNTCSYIMESTNMCLEGSG